MKITIHRDSKTPIYMQIKNQIKALIVNGELAPGVKLLPERMMAQIIGVSRGTISHVYAELCADGLIRSKHGDGFRVDYNARECDSIVKSGMKTRKMLSNPWKYFAVNQNVKLNLGYEEYSSQMTKDRINFSDCDMDPNRIPVVEIRQVIDRLFAQKSNELFAYASPKGLPVLRNGIGKILATKSINASTRNIQIVSDTNVAIDHILRMYVKEGDTVITAEPIFTDTYQLLKLNGAKVITVPVDHHSMRLDILEPLLRKYNPKLIHAMPDFHNPTGITMPYERRAQMLELAYYYGTPIIEENPLSDFRYRNTMVASLKSMDKQGYVVYLGAYLFSLIPGTKISYVVADERIIKGLGKLTAMTRCDRSVFEQHLLSEMIDNGLYEQYLETSRLHYKEKWKTALGALEKGRQIGLEWIAPDGGLFIWCRLPVGVNENELQVRCLKKGVDFSTGSMFFPHGTDGNGYIRLCFSGPEKDEIEKGIFIILEEIKALKE